MSSSETDSAPLAPPRLPQQARSRATRAALLTAAAALFSARGFEATTMDAIAEQAGVSVGIVYRYFRSKSQILLTVLQERLTEIRLNLSELPASGLTLDALTGELRRYLVCERQYLALHRAKQELLLRQPDLAAEDRRQFTALAAALAAQLARGRQAGILRPDLDPVPAAEVVLLLAAELRALLPFRTDDEMEPVIAAAARMIRHALRPDAVAP